MKPGRLLPDSLVGRTVLVLVVGLILSQVAGSLFLSRMQGEIAASFSRRQISDSVTSIIQLMEDTKAEDRARVLRSLTVPGLHVFYGPVPLDGGDDIQGLAFDVGQDLRSRFPAKEVHASIGDWPPPPERPGPRPDDPGRPGEGGRRFGQDSGPGPMHGPGHGPDGGGPPGMGEGPRHGGGGAQPWGGPPPPRFGWSRPPFGTPGETLVRVATRLDDGTWLSFLAPRNFGETFLRRGVVIPLVIGILVVLALSVAAVRRAAKPLKVVADAAQRLGRDVGAPPVPVEGPREVRAAALAFNDMQTRLRRFVEDRTLMIAAISHDLRTPITRMRLRAEFIDDDEIQGKMLADLDEMEAMIAQTLTFAREDSARVDRAEVDLAAMVKGLCEDFGASYQGPDHLTLRLGAIAIKRALANLMDNARKYGGGAEVALEPGPALVHVVVEDQGPGIPEEEMERVFRPFVRLEGSRNRDTGGTGLGLAMARTALRAHGGDIVFSNRPEGGLRAVVILPA